MIPTPMVLQSDRTKDHREVLWRCPPFGCPCEWIQDIRFYLPPNHGWSDRESLCAWTLSAKQDSWKDLWHYCCHKTHSSFLEESHSHEEVSSSKDVKYNNSQQLYTWLQLYIEISMSASYSSMIQGCFRDRNICPKCSFGHQHFQPNLHPSNWLDSH